MLRSAVDERIKERGWSAIADLSRRFEAVVLERRAEFSHPDPPLAAEACFRMVFATLPRRTMLGPTIDSGVELEWERLVHELGSACIALLFTRPVPRIDMSVLEACRAPDSPGAELNRDPLRVLIAVKSGGDCAIARLRVLQASYRCSMTLAGAGTGG